MGALFNALVTASLNNRLFVLIGALVLIGYGGFTLTKLPVDVFPDLNRPTVTLMTEAEGMAPEEVEQLVTYPLETAMKAVVDAPEHTPAIVLRFALRTAITGHFAADQVLHHGRHQRSRKNIGGRHGQYHSQRQRSK